jgi:tripartite-type tricarboxylate transporter receptor subunit TctC
MRTGFAAIAFATLMSVNIASAQDWPTRSPTLVVPYAAGAGVDLMGRILGARLAEILGRPIVIENVGGAGGVAGVARVAKAAPDGYQFVIGDTGALAVSQTMYKTPPFNSVTDLAAVALIAESPQILLARKDLPADNLPEFTTYAKANQARMQYGTAGVGSPGHLTCLLLNAAAGLDITHIPYRGAGPALQDLVAGRIDYQCTVGPSAIPQIESKLVKAIAVLSRERSPNLPSVASAHEQGLAGFDASTWFAVFLPKGTPEPIVTKLREAVVAAMETPATRQRLSEIGLTIVDPNRRSSEYLRTFVASEIAKWAAPIKAGGVAMD